MTIEKIEVDSGKGAKVELKSVANTPFRWELSTTGRDISSEMDVIPAKKSKTAQLKSVFTLKARTPGTYKIEFELSAPFIGAPISRKQYEITFK